MKKKVLLMATLATLTATAVNAQTRIGETNKNIFRDQKRCYIPAELTSNGVALLYYYDDSTATFCDQNLTATEIQRPERCVTLFYMNLDNPEETYISYSQTFFNNDATFEYIRYTVTNERLVTSEWETYTDYDITKLEAVNMNGTVLFSLDAPENTTFGYAISWGGGIAEVSLGVLALRWGGASYLVVNEQDSITEDEKLVFYRINQQTQSIARVDGSLPISVFPSVADRNQTLTVELGEGNNATEVQVVNAVGHVVKSVAVQPGQHEVQLRASDLGSGMHIVGARNHKSQGACKIIIK
ncbi:MAG: hypothetical protein IJ789_07630 [Bacteroidales bacterium]|nr:hypothetical protein [Bacteroidales bacterium]